MGRRGRELLFIAFYREISHNRVMRGEWFIRLGDCHKGPFNSDQIMDLWQRGEIGLSQMFWKKGMVHWQRFDSIEELQGLFPPRKVLMTPVREQESPREVALKKDRGEQSFFLVGFFILALFGGIAFWKLNGRIIKPDGLAQEEFLYLKEVVGTPVEKEVIFRFSFDPGVNRLWLSSNLTSKDDFFVKLNSIQGKVLTMVPIECIGEGRFYQHFAQLDYFDFTKGSQFYPGFYRIYLSYSFKGKNRSFSDVIYLGAGDQVEFSKKLAIYRESLEKAFQGHSSELIQSYATLASLLTKTEALLYNRLKGLKSGVKTANFEREYAMHIGPMLTKFTSDQFFQPSRIPAGLNQLRRQFDIIFDLSQSLSGLSAEIIQEVRGKKNISASKKSRLQEFYGSKFKALKHNMHLQQERIKSLKLFP